MSVSIREGLSAARLEALSCKPVEVGENPLDLHRELCYLRLLDTHQKDIPVVDSCPNAFHTSTSLLHVIFLQGFLFIFKLETNRTFYGITRALDRLNILINIQSLSKPWQVLGVPEQLSAAVHSTVKLFTK